MRRAVMDTRCATQTINQIRSKYSLTAQQAAKARIVARSRMGVKAYTAQKNKALIAKYARRLSYLESRFKGLLVSTATEPVRTVASEFPVSKSYVHKIRKALAAYAALIGAGGSEDALRRVASKFKVDR
jgi:hypothetical protein